MGKFRMRYFTATAAVLAALTATALLASVPARAELGGPKHVGALCSYQNPMAPSDFYYLDKCPETAKAPVVHHPAHKG